MLYTLFSPSEGKNTGGNRELFKDLLFGNGARESILTAYNDIVNSGNLEAIRQLFGLKKDKEIQPYLEDLYNAPLLSAIERYSGVAYDYLDYPSLPVTAQEYIKRHTVIFSNLFGPIMAGDLIPNYKVKQGNAIAGITPEKYYKDAFAPSLDALLEDADILDLRAGYYEKFYKTSKPYTTLKFIKDGKVVSHWAKAYRGIVLRHLALNAVESLDAFMQMEIDGLLVEEIKLVKNKREIVYAIKD
jgi:cytoplasmic iron level regulating protein YaaA (DUF328/UPF0246 family)